ADGDAVARLAAIASRRGVHVVAGFAEAAADTRHDAAVLVGPEGVVGHYRGLHLDAATRAWARPGTRFVVHDTPVGRIGLLLGGDALLPEAARVLALRGCDLIACPAAITARTTMPHAGSAIAQNWPIPTGADAHHWHHLRCRAGENNVYFAYANAVGDAAGGDGGRSGVFGPDTFAFPRREGIVAAGEGIAAAEIDTTNLDTPYTTNVVRRKDLVLMRLPHHYAPLIARN
ncbi:nitrilase-related carbon-nitrogen hydrolase, partial [Acidisphaera rubrifaciens]|uniref:nitrilase-related carbon-nitrogen hydrolase n=1 Tax=Acidisphaera rubrifaciens TaxID=50715 RepID=UPI0006625BCB